MRRPVKNRKQPQPDEVYGSIKVSKLINYVMERGKKDTARKIVYKVMDELKKEGDPVAILLQFVHHFVNDLARSVLLAALHHVVDELGYLDRAVHIVGPRQVLSFYWTSHALEIVSEQSELTSSFAPHFLIFGTVVVHGKFAQ